MKHVMRALFLLVLAPLLACPGPPRNDVDAGAGDGGVGDASSLDISNPFDGALVGQVLISRPEPEGPDDPGRIYSQAEFYDRPWIDLADRFYLHDSQGPCQLYGSTLYERWTYICDPPCPSDQICAPRGECVPTPQFAPAGVITVAGLSEPLRLEPSSQRYDPATASVDISYQPGDRIRAVAEGGQTSGFQVEATGIEPLRLELEQWTTILDHIPLRVRWQPGDVAAARVEIRIDTNLHLLPRSVLRCVVDDSGGFDVPASLLQQLPYHQDLIGGTSEVTVTRFSEGYAPVAHGVVRLRVQSSAIRHASRSRPLMQVPATWAPCTTSTSLLQLADRSWQLMDLAGDDSHATLTWTASTPGGQALWQAALGPSGELGSNTLVTQLANPVITELTHRRLDDHIWLVWALPATGGQALWFARIDDSGQIVVAPTEIAQTRQGVLREPQLVGDAAPLHLLWIGGDVVPDTITLLPVDAMGEAGGPRRQVHRGAGAILSVRLALREAGANRLAWLEQDPETSAPRTIAHTAFLRDEGGPISPGRLTMAGHHSDAIDLVCSESKCLIVWTERRDADGQTYSILRMNSGLPYSGCEPIPLTAPLPGELDLWPRLSIGQRDRTFVLTWVHARADAGQPGVLLDARLRLLHFAFGNCDTIGPRAAVVEWPAASSAQLSHPQLTRQGEDHLIALDVTVDDAARPGFAAAQCPPPWPQ